MSAYREPDLKAKVEQQRLKIASLEEKLAEATKQKIPWGKAILALVRTVLCFLVGLVIGWVMVAAWPLTLIIGGAWVAAKINFKSPKRKTVACMRCKNLMYVEGLTAGDHVYCSSCDTVHHISRYHEFCEGRFSPSRRKS